MKSLANYIIESIEITTEANAFAILKPSFLGHLDDFYQLLNDEGWQIVKAKKQLLTLNKAKELYECHKNKDFYDDLCNYMTSRECLCCACFKDCKDPIKAMKTVKNKFRDKFGIDEMKNGMHSSDSASNVKREISICLE